MSKSADPTAGILAMCAAMAAFNISDVFTKLATTTLPVGEVIALRGILSVAVFGIPVLLSGALPVIWQRMSKPWATRVLGEMGGTVTFIPALALLPFANVVALAQSTPLVMTAAGALFLGERVSWRQWCLTGLGFAGMLLIVKPGALSGLSSTSAPTWWYGLVAITVISIVIRDLATRRMEPGLPATVVALTTATGATLIGFGLSAVQGGWRMPSPLTTAYLAGAALAVAAGYYFTIQSVRKAELSVLAPFRYTILPMSLLAGWLVWQELPDRYALLGIAVIAAAGIATFLRQRP